MNKRPPVIDQMPRQASNRVQTELQTPMAVKSWVSGLCKMAIITALCLLATRDFLRGLVDHRESTAVWAAASAPKARVKYKLSYTRDGDLVPPVQYREWVYLTSGLDMSYNPKASPGTDDMSMFDNVFVNPEAYRVFLATGAWPDKTIFVLESRGASQKGSINKAGHFQSGPVMGLELHVKDEKRFPGKWAFFDVANEAKATLIPQKAPCYSCHADHAAVDTTFVQFYPTLLPIAQKQGTLKPGYDKDEVTTSSK